MKAFLTQKQEAFCLAYIETGNASEAYRRVYNASRMKNHVIEVEASRLLKNPEVTLRIGAIRRRAAEIANVTIVSHLKALHRLRERSVKKGQMSAAVRAEQLRGEVAGLYDEPGRLKDRPASPVGPESTPSVKETARALLVLMKHQRR